jgi:hypothetical protein
LSVLTLSIPPHSHASDENTSSFDPIWSIFIKDDDIQVERPYTPLFGIDEEGTIKLWVKRYQRGEVGRWLHSKKAGDTIEIRGPLKTFPFEVAKWDEVVMVYLCAPLLVPFLLLSQRFSHRYLGEQVFRRSTSYCFDIFSKAMSWPVPASRFFTHPAARQNSRPCPFYNLLSILLSRIPIIFA